MASIIHIKFSVTKPRDMLELAEPVELSEMELDAVAAGGTLVGVGSDEAPPPRPAPAPVLTGGKERY